MGLGRDGTGMGWDWMGWDGTGLDWIGWDREGMEWDREGIELD